MRTILILVPLLLAVSLLGYFSLSTRSPSATDACVTLCKQVVSSIDTSSGPCLSNDIASDWVCDMVHNPRIPTDNLPDNQCSAFVKGEARHFVEVDMNCTVVRVY